MSTITQSLRSYLLAGVNVAALTDRAYLANRPQGTGLPAFTITRISAGQEHDLDGAAANANPRIQIDCFADSAVECEALAEAVRERLDGKSGTVGDHTVDAVVLDNWLDLTEVPVDGSDARTYHITLDFFVRFVQAIPTLT